MKHTLSAIVITKNEAETIKRCLGSLNSLADEVIVVDSGSVDKTTEIARKAGAKVYSRKLVSYSDQRNFAITKASGEWILSMDADEVIPLALATEIKAGMARPDINGFLIPRRNFIFGAEIKHTRWSPDKHIWLFRKSRGKFVGDIHEEAQVQGPVGELRTAKVHYSYSTVTEFVSMLNNYTQREAAKELQAGLRFSYWQLAARPLASFLRRFVYKLGFLDGWRGFVLAYLMAVYRFTVVVKKWEKAN